MKKVLVVGIIVLFIGIVFVPSFNAFSIKEETVSKNSEPADSSVWAFLFGRIKNLHQCPYDEYFYAVNLFIISLDPPGFYHLKSGEKVYMYIEGASGGHLGILNNFFIFALCYNPEW